MILATAKELGSSIITRTRMRWKRAVFLLVVILDFLSGWVFFSHFWHEISAQIPAMNQQTNISTGQTIPHKSHPNHGWRRSGGWLRYARSRDQIAKPILAFWYLGAGDFWGSNNNLLRLAENEDVLIKVETPHEYHHVKVHFVWCYVW